MHKFPSIFTYLWRLQLTVIRDMSAPSPFLYLSLFPAPFSSLPSYILLSFPLPLFPCPLTFSLHSSFPFIFLKTLSIFFPSLFLTLSLALSLSRSLALSHSLPFIRLLQTDRLTQIDVFDKRKRIFCCIARLFSDPFKAPVRLFLYLIVVFY